MALSIKSFYSSVMKHSYVGLNVKGNPNDRLDALLETATATATATASALGSLFLCMRKSNSANSLA
jgi:hypothetical protein